MASKLKLTKRTAPTLKKSPKSQVAFITRLKYAVEYIVKNTIGKLIENKTPKDISKINKPP